MIFTLYSADMELWLDTSSLFNYADDTTMCSKSKSLMEIKLRLEEDAINVLRFMASNSLVANQGKSEFLLLNNKDKAALTKIKVGNSSVLRTENTKLLGIIIEDTHEWNLHLKSLKSSLNQRLFVIRRISCQIPKNKIMSVVHSLWVSKLRYGLQLCSKVRFTEEEPNTKCMKSLQLTQNRLLRALNNLRVKDKINISSMLERFDLLSVNQLAAQIKYLEVWKAVYVEGYSIELEPYKKDKPLSHHELRTQKNRVFNDSARLKIASQSFNIDAARLWNLGPASITESVTITLAKKAIQIFVKTLPI